MNIQIDVLCSDEVPQNFMCLEMECNWLHHGDNISQSIHEISGECAIKKWDMFEEKLIVGVLPGKA